MRLISAFLDPGDHTRPVVARPDPDHTADAPPGAASTEPATMRQLGPITRVDDPVHGLDVSTTVFLTALRQPADTLTTLLARRPWLPTYPEQPLFVTAALAALHATADLPPTGPPGPAPSGPCADSPTIPRDLPPEPPTGALPAPPGL
jgi:hypothetical protein